MLVGGTIVEIEKTGMYTKLKQTFNLQDPVEKALSRIN
jgi:hypothetical protein